MNDEKMNTYDGKIVCTMCGNELDECDIDAHFNFERYIGFGSKYDLCIFEAQLCCKCYDNAKNTLQVRFTHK